MVQQQTINSSLPLAASFRGWWHAKSETFTALCGSEGDVFTHGDVVKSHLYVLVLIIFMLVAWWLEGGAAW